MPEVQGNLALVPVIQSIPTVPEEKVNELSLSANDLLVIARKQGKITSIEQFEVVNEEILRIKNYKKQVEDLFRDSKAKAHETHKSICESEKKLLKPAEEAEKTYSPLLIDYTREQERLRREAEEKSRKEAEEKARLEREAKLKEAEIAMDSGVNLEEVMSLIDEAETIVAVPEPIKFQTIKPTGINIRQNWTWECTDINKVPREYLKIDEQKLNAIAKAGKGSIAIPGIRFYDAGSVAKAR